MKISVIVPTYRPQGYLWECLDSVYNQTFPKSDYELVLVLNGCDEPFHSQIKDWLGKHHCIHNAHCSFCNTTYVSLHPTH